uniref:Uncharacterized protein n=1 Tax=Oryza barthii TaxID=65489 RepID=A0A0D3F2D3_9ORYZ
MAATVAQEHGIRRPPSHLQVREESILIPSSTPFSRLPGILPTKLFTARERRTREERLPSEAAIAVTGGMEPTKLLRFVNVELLKRASGIPPDELFAKNSGIPPHPKFGGNSALELIIAKHNLLESRLVMELRLPMQGGIEPLSPLELISPGMYCSKTLRLYGIRDLRLEAEQGSSIVSSLIAIGREHEKTKTAKSGMSFGKEANKRIIFAVVYISARHAFATSLAYPTRR